MRDIALQISGALTILIAVVHGVLGETRIFARARIEPAWAKRILRAVWHGGAVAWLGGGVQLILSAQLPPEALRRWIVVVLVLVYGCGAAGNAWASRGRHFGWMAMVVVIAFALFGL